MEALLTLCLAGDPVTADRLWSSWSLAPETLGPLVVGSSLYYAAALRRYRRSHGERHWHEVTAFSAGMVLLGVALVSPLCRMAATVAWAHMIQHLILVALAPPLLVMGSMHLWSEDADAGRLSSRWTSPAATAGLYGVAIWFWHIPLFYDAALSSAPLHLAMYASLLLVALLFWSSIILATGRSQGASVIALLITTVHTGFLGALLTFSPTLWYPLMARGAILWGLTPLEDQQLAGLIMWVPMGLIYLTTALTIVAYALAHLSTGAGSGRSDSPA